MTFGFGCMVFVHVGYSTWMPSFLAEKFSLSLANAGFSSLFYHHLGALLGVLSGARIADHYANKQPKVRLIVQQKPNPYADKIGTKLIVLGAQILELNAGKVVDSGDLTVDDVQALFAAAPVVGYKASAPQVRAAAPEADNGDYDF